MGGGAHGSGGWTGNPICTCCGILTTTSERRCGGEFLSHNHVTLQRKDKNSMPPCRFPINAAMRDVSDLGHYLLLLSFSAIL